MSFQTTNDSGFTTAAAGQPMGDTMDWHSTLHELTAGLVSGGVGGEYFNKMKEAFTKTAEALLNDKTITRIIALKRQDYEQLKYSCLILAFQQKAHPDVVSYYTMIMEATGDGVEDKTITINNRPVRVRRTAADAYDDELRRLAKEVVEANFPNATSRSASAILVTSSTLHDQSTKVEAIIRGAILACAAVVQQTKGTQVRLDLNKISKDYHFALEMALNHKGVVYDEQGIPMRSNILIRTSSEARSKRNNNNIMNVNTRDDRRVLCELSAFVNPVWAPTGQSFNFGFNPMMLQPNQLNAMGIPNPSAKLVAELVITAVNTSYGTSPAMVLLALASSMLACDNNNWMQALIPRPGSTEQQGRNLDITNLGALNIICNIQNETDKNGYGSRVDMKELENNLSLLSQYITTIFRPGMILSLDCPVVSPQSWYLNVFAQAASGNQQAIATILDAADELTGGAFGKIFPAQGRIFVSAINLTTGYYPKGNQLCDARDIDLTAISNLYANHPEQIHQWTKSFADPNLDPLTAASIREEITDNALHGECKFNGKVVRATFSKEFTQAFSTAIRGLNLQTSLTTPLSPEQIQSGMMAPSYVDGALAMATNTFSNNYVAGFNTNVNGIGNNASRFG